MNVSNAETKDPGGSSRLDILLYAHDGRGMGHISRAITLGLAIRRYAPNRSVAVVTGSPWAHSLISGMPLEVIKLPSYDVEVVEGDSSPRLGWMNLSNQDLITLRARLLRELVLTARPRQVVVDHLPLGKNRELEPAIEATESLDTEWNLGLRSIVGSIEQLTASDVRELVRRRFRRVLWFADPSISRRGHLQDSVGSFGLSIHAIGYVSRAREMELSGGLQTKQEASGVVVTLSWTTRRSSELLHALLKLIRDIKDSWGPWRFFVGPTRDRQVPRASLDAISLLPWCKVQNFDPNYLGFLRSARLAIAYSGYNTVTDILWAGCPAVLVSRDMADGEQHIHAKQLQDAYPDSIAWVPEQEIKHMELHHLCDRLVGSPPRATADLNGAEKAARLLINLERPRK